MKLMMKIPYLCCMAMCVRMFLKRHKKYDGHVHGSRKIDTGAVAA